MHRKRYTAFETVVKINEPENNLKVKLKVIIVQQVELTTRTRKFRLSPGSHLVFVVEQSNCPIQISIVELLIDQPNSES